jgi:hypothetical protein
MTVIQSASRYAYTPAYRARLATSDDASGFSPSLTEQTDPDGSNAGNPVKIPVSRRVEESSDTRFEFSLSYRSAFFNATGSGGGRDAARDETASTRSVAATDDTGALFSQPENDGTDAATENPGADAADDLPENPVDLLASLLGG